mgnify:CR=1 FL=1
MPFKNQFKSNKEYNEYFREYRKRNLKKMRAYQKEYNRKWRSVNGYSNEEKWKKNNPIKLAAQKILRYAVKIGKIKKLPCKVCGKKRSVGHHPDYSKPLKVIWLCHIHHREYHYRINKKVIHNKEKHDM